MTQQKEAEITLSSEESKDVFRIKDGVLVGYTGASGDVVIPDGVTEIGFYAFADCESLTSVTIPNSVIEINGSAFRDCESLTSVTIPESVIYIGYAAFGGCSSLTSIKIPESVIIDGPAFYGTPWLENERSKNPLVIINNILIDGETAIGDVVIPEGVVCNAQAAFSGSNLKSIIIPESVTSIKQEAFNDCGSLISIAIPKGVTYIGNYTFEDCSSLTSIMIPESVTDIGYAAFRGCSSLKSITIPESVTDIFEDAFSDCHNDFTVFVTPGSYAETYAKDNDIPYHYIEQSEHIHSYQNQITTQPGCTTAGVRTYTCSGCGDSYTETIVATGHKYTKATTNPTCTAEGAITYTCSVCNHSYKEEIAAIGHKYTKTTTNATCTAKGAVTYICSVCKYSYKEEIAATGHKYTKTTKNPTCTVKGAVTCTCSVCKYSYIEKTLPATGHKYVTTTVAATMGKNGAITTSCTVCKTKKETTIYAPKSISLSKTESIYNGKQQKPGVIIKDEKGKNLRNGSDYTVSYQKDMKNVGIYFVTISFKGNYSGKTEMIFTINPKGTSISKEKPVKKGFELKWKKQSSQTTGYEIAYSTSSKFSMKNTKTLTVKKSKTTSKTISELKAKKKYYVRIRTYKTVKVNGKSTKRYSVWSKVKTVKTKNEKIDDNRMT